jgi:LuxR family transcriptional regulator, maltose regulon positive regulatory protein
MMDRVPTTLRKISRPGLFDPLNRERLFEKIERAINKRQTLFIVAPPGAGKTTLATSWLEARRKHVLWVQCDSADGDPANLFYYLREAAESILKKGARALPRATPEFLADARGFARRFFRELFVRLPSEIVIVLDDYHEIPDAAPIHELIAGAITEIPQGSALLVLSREPAPKAYARALANGQLDTLDAFSLTLTGDETRLIVRKRLQLEEETISQLHEYCAGWPAGLVLLLERMYHGVGFACEQQPELLHNVFNYFSSQIFSALPNADRELLLRTAFLESFDAKAASRIAGDEFAGKLVDALYRRNLFVERVRGTGMYQFHPLFARFLRQHASEQLTVDELNQLKTQSAVLLGELGMVDQAVTLAIEVSAWDQAAQLIDTHGQAISWHGRVGTLQRWISALPEAISASHPWHRYWLANALLTTEPGTARRLGRATFAHFNDLDDRLGMLASACLILHSYHRDFSFSIESVEWLKVAERLNLQIKAIADPKMQLEIEISLMIGKCFLQNDRTALARMAPSIEERLALVPDDDRKLALFTAVMSCFNIFGHFRHAVDVLRRAEYLMHSDSCSEYNKTFFATKAFYPLVMSGNLERAREVASLVVSWARGARFEPMLRVGLAFLAGTYLWSDLPKSIALVLELDQLPSRENQYVEWHERLIRGKLAALVGAREQALLHVQQVQASSGTAGFFWLKVESAAWFSDIALAVDDIDRANQIASQGLKLAQTIGTCQQEVALRAVLGSIALRRGDVAKAITHITKFLQCCHDPDHLCYLRRMLVPIKQLVAFAAEHNLETEFLPSLVSTLDIEPPVGVASWPWPIRVYTLGAFRIEVNGQAPTLTRKAPKKAFALLKALIAFGGNVSQHKLIDALWPDSDGDAAQKAFEATLHRLRRLLGGNDLIRQSDGVISLNQNKVFVDAIALDCDLDCHETRQLYRGTFLPDDDAPWVAQYRDRLHSRFISPSNEVKAAATGGG